MAAVPRKSRAGKPRSSRSRPEPPADAKWTFLSNHSHVLIVLSGQPDLTLREVAQRVGITERSVVRIIGDLEAGGYVERERHGARNSYTIRRSPPLRHPVEAHCTIGDLIRMVEKGR